MPVRGLLGFARTVEETACQSIWWEQPQVSVQGYFGETVGGRTGRGIYPSIICLVGPVWGLVFNVQYARCAWTSSAHQSSKIQELLYLIMVGQIIKCVRNQTPLNGKETVVSPNVISLHPEPFCVLHRTVLSRCVRACKSTSSTQESIKMGMESTAVWKLLFYGIITWAQFFQHLHYRNMALGSISPVFRSPYSKNMS